jgi:epsilon-lactone hydrolase
VPDYRLAPEHPYPAAVEDAARAYRWLLERGGPVAVAGNSSGCGLVLSLLLRLRRERVPMPSVAVLLCPWHDMRLESLDPASDDLAEFRRMGVELYLTGQQADGPLTADLAGLPPLLIQAATGDPLLGEARELAEHAADDGVDVHFGLFPVDTHDFHLFWSFLPEAAEAMRQAGQFIHTGTASKLGSGLVH